MNPAPSKYLSRTGELLNRKMVRDLVNYEYFLKIERLYD